MPATLEREIKLRFDSAAGARSAVLAIGARPFRARRLQQDVLLDTESGTLRNQLAAMRVRIESGTGVLTFKGPVLPSSMKVREEIETAVADPRALLGILEHAGFGVWFRYEKYREEFSAPDVVIAIDETPLGVFVEIEGTETGISTVADQLGRQPGDYILASYRSLFAEHCSRLGVPLTHMVFERA
jgi:adenylate cyclase class 2